MATHRCPDRDVLGLTVAVCQLDGTAALRTPDAFGAAVRQAVDQGAELVVLPELATCGGVLTDPTSARLASQRIDGLFVTRCAELSGELGVVIVAGFAEAGDNQQTFNSAVLVDRGEVIGVYRKVHLWGAEKNAFSTGESRPLVADTSAGRIGVMICYDLEFPEWVRLAAEAGAELLAVPVNWPTRADDPGPPFEIVKAQAAAATYRISVAVADRCGTEAGVDWYGASLIADSDGRLLAGPATDLPASPSIQVARVDLAVSRNKELGDFNHAFTDRRPDLYR